MITYLKINAANNKFIIEQELDPNKFNIGETYEDYLNGAFIKLTDDQLSFIRRNPNASIKEIIGQYIITPNVDLLSLARKEKLQKLAEYDISPAVNSFTINESIIAWFTPAERSNYKQSVESAKLLNKDKLTFIVDNIILEVPTKNAELMLAMLQDYADQCYIQTAKHRMNIEALDNIEDINGYDYIINYPDKLNFTI